MITNFFNDVNNIVTGNKYYLEQLILKIIEKYNKKVHKIVKKDKETYHKDGKRSRIVNFGNGIQLKIIRELYFNTQTRKSEIKLDELIGLTPRKRFQGNVLKTIIERFLDVYSLKVISEEINISVSGLSKMLSSIGINVTTKKLTDNVNTLYINIDGIFVNQNKKQRKEVKNIIMYTGFDKQKKTYKNGKIARKKKLNPLENRIIIPFKVNDSINDMVKRTQEITKSCYGSVKKIIVVGDGARWITKFTKKLGTNAERYIDQFHYTKTLNNYKKRLKIKDKINFYQISNMKRSEFIRYINHLEVNDTTGEIKKDPVIDNMKAFLVKWFISWKICRKKGYINAIEATQSSYFAKYFKYRRSFSNDNTYRLAIIKACILNGWSYELVDRPINIVNFL